MFKLSSEGVEYIKKEIGRYETKHSAIIPALYRVQEENGGWVNSEAISHLSEVMELPETDIAEVFSFYTMFNKKPVGKYHIQVCCNIACAVNLGRELADHILNHLGVKENEVTNDGLFVLSRVECLGACGTSPMMQINDQYYESLTPEKAIEILRELK